MTGQQIYSHKLRQYRLVFDPVAVSDEDKVRSGEPGEEGKLQGKQLLHHPAGGKKKKVGLEEPCLKVQHYHGLSKFNAKDYPPAKLDAQQL